MRLPSFRPLPRKVLHRGGFRRALSQNSFSSASFADRWPDAINTFTIPCSHFNPNGRKILSLAALAAISPPHCIASAPTKLYIVCANTVSCPDAFRSSDRLGFHLTTFSSSYCFAKFDSLWELRIWSLVNLVTFSMPSNAGCWKTSSRGRFRGRDENGAERRAMEHCRSTMRLPR